MILIRMMLMLSSSSKTNLYQKTRRVADMVLGMVKIKISYFQTFEGS